MGSRRNKWRPELRLTIWKPVGDFYVVERLDLEGVIAANGRSENELKRRMGEGYKLLEKAFEGHLITVGDVWFIETSIAADGPVTPPHSYPPRGGPGPEKDPSK